MKFVKYDTFPKLRREYGTVEEMGRVIFRKNNYMHERLSGRKSFTYEEKKALLEHIGKTAEDIPAYFPEYTQEAKAS